MSEIETIPPLGFFIKCFIQFVCCNMMINSHELMNSYRNVDAVYSLYNFSDMQSYKILGFFAHPVDLVKVSILIMQCLVNSS